MVHLLAILGLGVACVAWFLIQRWRQRARTNEPEAPAKGCGFCAHRDTCGAPSPEDEAHPACPPAIEETR